MGAAAAALLAVYFKRYRAKYSSVTVMSWQLLGGFSSYRVAIPVYVSLMPPEPFIPTWPDTLYLPIFAIFCTLFMYILQIQSLEHISAFTVNLSYNLEPIYSIILAMIIRRAHMTSVLPSAQASDSSHFPWRCRPARSCAAGSARSASRPERLPRRVPKAERLKTETKSFVVFLPVHGRWYDSACSFSSEESPRSP